jgi:putative oxidoreductase
MPGSSAPRINRGIDVGLWILQIAGAAMFFMAGIPKLIGDEQMAQVFETIGLGQWFRYATGLIEIVSAILLLTPGLAGLGAIILVPTMIGAILTHLFIIGGSPAIPAGLLIAMAIVAWGRRKETRRLIGR